MRKTGVLLLLLVSTLVAQAQLQPSKKTLSGLKSDTTYVVINDEIVESSDFEIGSSVYFYMEGISGFSIKDGKSFPGCTMSLVNQAGVVLKEFEDLFVDYKEGVSNDDVRSLQVYLSIGLPLKANQSYKWNVFIWDKIGKGSMNYEIPLHVIPAVDRLGIKTTSHGITVDNVYALDGAPLSSSEVDIGDEIKLVFDGVKGFQVSATRKVRLGMAIKIMDASGTAVMDYTDLFSSGEEYDADAASVLSSTVTVGDPIMSGGKYTWWVKIWDKSTNKYMESEIKLQVK